ncbi:MAG: hypothetical protein WCL14_14350 [Bacteroidota bacterium]
MKKIMYQSLVALSLVAVLLIASCSKRPEAPCGQSAAQSQTQSLDKKIRDLIGKIPHMKVDNSLPMGTLRRAKSGGWDFSNPSTGLPAYSDNSNTLYISSNSFGGNSTSGGTVVAGPTSLDINYTFCFASDDGGSALGGSLFSGSGAPLTGISGVMGICGDFSLFQSADSTTNFGDIFKGFAFYIVYDGRASGSYDVIDWTNANFMDHASIDKKCFSLIFDYKNNRLFLSSGGQINVSGGSMNFNGTYIEVDDLLANLNGNLTYSYVNGFGAMGCN